MSRRHSALVADTDYSPESPADSPSAAEDIKEIKVIRGKFYDLTLNFQATCNLDVWVTFTTSKKCDCSKCHNTVHLICITKDNTFVQVKQSEPVKMSKLHARQDFFIRSQFTCLSSRHGIFKLIFSLRNEHTEVQRSEVNVKVVSDRTARYVSKKNGCFINTPATEINMDVETPPLSDTNNSSETEPEPEREPESYTPTEFASPATEPIFQYGNDLSFMPIQSPKQVIYDWTKEVILCMMNIQSKLFDNDSVILSNDQMRLLNEAQQLIQFMQNSSHRL